MYNSQQPDADQRHLQRQLRHLLRRRDVQRQQQPDADQRHLQRQLRNNGGGMYNWFSSPTLTNVILWGDSAPTGRKSTTYSSTPYHHLQRHPGRLRWHWQHQRRSALRGTDGGNNIDTDPLRERRGGNLRLQLTSPAIDAGNNSAVPSASPPTWTATRAHQDGNGDNSPIVDMGAYEAQDTIPLTVTINQAAGQPDPTMRRRFSSPPSSANPSTPPPSRLRCRPEPAPPPAQPSPA
jgi:hypothetical protein